MTPRKLSELAVFYGACQKISELARLIAVLRRRTLRTVVEIGTARGGTFWLWCQLAEPDATLVSIDLPGGDFGGGYTPKEMRRFKTYGRARQQLYFFRKDSHRYETVELLRKKLRGHQIDFLFIDGDHHYRGVKKDFALYTPLIADRGLIGFHDILPHPRVRNCTVDKFWAEIVQVYPSKEFVEPDDDRGWGQWGGIGLLVYRRR